MNPIIISKNTCKTTKQSPMRMLAFATGAGILVLAGSITSCRTANGFGQDVEKTGDKIQHAATH